MDKKVASLWRFYFVIVVLLVGAGSLLWRLIDLNLLQRNFLLRQSNARILRVVNIPAYRGMITDRFLQPLAISAQVDSIWVNPQLFTATPTQVQQLADALRLSTDKLLAKSAKIPGREFIYLKRGVSPSETDTIRALNIPGIYFQHEYHRFYPQSDVAAHLVGFTNIDDIGQEGLELAYDGWLKGVSGKKKVVKDRLGYIIADLGIVKAPKQGHNLVLSIDNRIQYLAYEELKDSMERFNAKSGSIVVLDTQTGEVLAMVNQPSFNPNHIENSQDGRYRNRAMTDLFEPGSTIKAFSVASALESGKFHPNSIIDTSPGTLNVNGDVIRDENNYGAVTLTKVLQKSSDVGVAKVTMSLPPQRLWELLRRMGFGERTATGFPGEAAGSLTFRPKWRPIELATLSFGYGLSVTAVQLAQAYAILASSGVSRPISLLKINQPPQGKPVLAPALAQQMLAMLEAVVQGGTGSLAKVPGYRVAGKTGTANIANRSGYDRDHYVSSFVGIAPVSNPRLVVAVVIRDPRGQQHLGAMVAAPIFSKVMAGSLRLLNISPDDVSDDREAQAVSGEKIEN